VSSDLSSDMSSEMRWGDLVVAGDARRRKLRERHGNGLDGAEVRDDGRHILVYFFEHVPHGLHPANIRIDAPRGARPVHAVGLHSHVEHGAEDRDPETEDHLTVELDHRGSAGTYLLRVVERRPDGTPGWRPYHGVDPRFAQLRFTFDVDAPRPRMVRPPAGTPGAGDPVSYVYRDYAGLRQLMLDRLAVTMPGWTERHEPDIWITLVELLAYIGDDLSYYQDAVATEAYLATARNRVSVRRHARLVGYRLHEGCQARAWVCVNVTSPVTLPLGDVRFAAAGTRAGQGSAVLDARTYPAGPLAAMRQYTPLSARPGARGLESELKLRPAHNEIGLWSWGELDSHLAAGATSAVLTDGAPLADDDEVADDDEAPRRTLDLRAGDVLILEQAKDPLTLGKGPADPALRQAVRLTGTRRLMDRLYRQPLLEVRWEPEDALGFDLAVMAGGHPCGKVSGNVVLVGNAVAATDTVAVSAPALTRAGLSYATPFPDPRIVARHQARALRSLYHRWREQVGEWRWRAGHGTPLSEGQLAVLRVQVGNAELERLGLAGRHQADQAGRADRAEQAEHEATALAELLARADRLLAGRRRRLGFLARIAEGTGPLQDVLIDELTEDWGAELTAALAAGRPGSWGPAVTATTQDPRAALPVLQLAGPPGDTWAPAFDLIGAGPANRIFVAEVDDRGIAALRINDPPAAATLAASYWIGNGTAGNAEAEAINALVWAPAPGGGAGPVPAPPEGIALVRNPLPASGGTDAETIAAAKQAIPGAFTAGQQRALTTQDYSTLATAVPGVRRAAAEVRFTGTLNVVDVAIQPEHGDDPADELRARVRRFLATVRAIGQVVDVLGPRYRPLVVALDVTLGPGTIRRAAAHDLARRLSNGWLPDGRPALFNPANLAFAAPVYASSIIAAAHAVPGVTAVTLTRLGFLDQPASGAASELGLTALEIARLDNDPAHPEHGYALVSLEGGR
jgi:predicted phage baseplate assembly protein